MSGLSRRLASKSVFRQQEPQDVSADGLAETWITRGGNFAVCVSEVRAGAVLARDDNPEEYMVIIPPGSASVTIEASGEAVDAEPDSLTIVPPGKSRITARSGGKIARIFSKASADIMARAVNSGVYADGAPELASVDLWPAPVGGFKLRHYPLAQYLDPKGDRIQPRCFRSTNMMVNLFGQFFTRRPTNSLSPHWHDDFEQGSLCFEGTWTHHLRYNWGADLSAWVPDDHAEMPTPSVIVIPALTIHTSRCVGKDGPASSLYDIFCPPRLDFAWKPGFVINEDEYPLPVIEGEQRTKTGGTLLSWQKPG
jgi:mannose-6-phosphate isomerase-like protein (cupin superfamily)